MTGVLETLIIGWAIFHSARDSIREDRPLVLDKDCGVYQVDQMPVYAHTIKPRTSIDLHSSSLKR